MHYNLLWCVSAVEDLKVDGKKLQDSHRQAMLRRKTKSGQGARKMKPWKYEARMSFLLSDLTPRQTESNIDVVEETEEREDGVGLTLDEEEEEQTESAFQNRRESRSKNGRKFGKRFDKEHNVDKVITFMQEKERDRKQPGELEYFFASVCESTKHLPRCFQLRVKQDVMKAILNAEMECLGTESSTFSTEFCHQAQPSPAASQSSSEARIATTGYNNQAQENASGLSDGCARSNDSSF
ncbi:hypothetical protein B7P43_G15662 [Cryptotermes secundus]|uniref:BESS domain-containing protein n=1 Tax=Cryptotermes secundus TaxID=105785 RepID=A0A2J7RQV4_9NEOP|nr:hypothetical protein B7P43_G15662 [Cryptotermes secundus]